MIEKTKIMMSKLGIKGEIIEHPDINGTHSEFIAKKLDIPLENIIKCLILKSKKGNLLSVIILGNQRVDLKMLEKISQMKKFTLASEKLVKESTGYPIGGVPPIAVINKMPVIVDKAVIKKQFVLGSAGTPYHGLKIDPKIFTKFNLIFADIHE
ncbi:MAG: aminoacyl-tRNA deacylase [Promethearchaeota archaeon]